MIKKIFRLQRFFKKIMKNKTILITGGTGFLERYLKLAISEKVKKLSSLVEMNKAIRVK